MLAVGVTGLLGVLGARSAEIRFRVAALCTACCFAAFDRFGEVDFGVGVDKQFTHELFCLGVASLPFHDLPDVAVLVHQVAGWPVAVVEIPPRSKVIVGQSSDGLINVDERLKKLKAGSLTMMRTDDLTPTDELLGVIGVD